MDEFENIYVADSQNSRVQAFDKDGNFLTAFGEPARNESGEIVPPPALGGPPFGDPSFSNQARLTGPLVYTTTMTSSMWATSSKVASKCYQ